MQGLWEPNQREVCVIGKSNERPEIARRIKRGVSERGGSIDARIATS